MFQDCHATLLLRYTMLIQCWHETKPILDKKLCQDCNPALHVATQHWFNRGIQYWSDDSKFPVWTYIGVQYLPDVDSQCWFNINPIFIRTWEGSCKYNLYFSCHCLQKKKTFSYQLYRAKFIKVLGSSLRHCSTCVVTKIDWFRIPPL